LAQSNFGSKFLKYAPIEPVLPTPPTHKSFAVNKWLVGQFHGMEEVVGSIPTRSTIKSMPDPSHRELPDHWGCLYLMQFIPLEGLFSTANLGPKNDCLLKANDSNLH
jgi:hypothetical protein